MRGLSQLSLTRLDVMDCSPPACLSSLTSLKHLVLDYWKPWPEESAAVIEAALPNLQSLTCLVGMVWVGEWVIVGLVWSFQAWSPCARV